MCENLAEKSALAFPLQMPIVGNAAHQNVAVVFQLRHAPRKLSGRSLIATGWGLILQRRMRAILVIDLLPVLKNRLLALRIARGRPQRVVLQSAMHTLMTSVVLRR